MQSAAVPVLTCKTSINSLRDGWSDAGELEIPRIYPWGSVKALRVYTAAKPHPIRGGKQPKSCSPPGRHSTTAVCALYLGIFG